VTIEVRPATRADAGALERVLGEAFQVEPVYVWLFPDPERRRRRLAPLIRTMRTHLYRDAVDQVAALDGVVVGAAVWDPPGHRTAGPWQVARALPGMLRATGARLPDLARLGSGLEAARPTTPHWYLFHVGVAPQRQGHGVGSALLHAMPPLRDGSPAHLECKPEHVGFYARFGFAVSGEVDVDPGLCVVTMWRD
jgi:GNAT superfamily N-acetyltransferase